MSPTILSAPNVQPGFAPDRRLVGFTLLSQTLVHLWQANPKATRLDVYNAMMAQADQMKMVAIGMGDNVVQGFIVWDISAEDAPLGPAPSSLVQFSKPWQDYYATGWITAAGAARYTGDPQLVHPALAAPDPTNPKRTILQAFFARLAPYKVGCCVRHGILVKDPHGGGYQRLATAYSYVWDICAKINMANKLYGCRLFYCDTNQNDQGFTLNVRPFEDEPIKEIRAVSDFVAMESTQPDGFEHTWSENDYLGMFAGFRDPKNGKLDAATILPSDAPPGSFRLIDPINGADMGRVDELAGLVRDGHVLMYHAWFPAAENEVIKAAWAKGVAPVVV